MAEEQNDAAILIGCGILRKEIRHLIKKNSWKLKTAFLPSSLHIDYDQLEKALSSALQKHPREQKIVFYGACHPLMDKILENKSAIRTAGQNCIDILLGTERFTRELSRGAFFLLEDWALHWQRVIYPLFGTNPENIRTIFTSEHTCLLAIRTPCSEDFSAKAREIAEITGLPLEWTDVTLDTLEVDLRTALDALKVIPAEELITIPRGESDRLQTRLDYLAQSKALLELKLTMLEKLSFGGGLETTLDNIHSILMETIAASDINIYYKVGGAWHEKGLFGNQIFDGDIDDPLVRLAIKSKTFVKRNDPDTKSAEDWLFPLLYQDDLIGVVKMRRMILTKSTIREDLEQFFRYASLALHNELNNYRSLAVVNERLEEAQQIAHIGNWELDVQTLTLWWSDEMFRLFGLDPTDQTPTFEQFKSLFNPVDRPKVLQLIDQAISDGQPFNNETYINLPTGDVRILQFNARTIRDGNQKVLRLVGTTQDVTEQKLAEEEIRKFNEELEQRVAERTMQLETANQELESFCYSVSHDLRAPLRHLNGFSIILEEDCGPKLSEADRQSLKKIRSAAAKMGNLIDALLNLSLVNRSEIKLATIDLSEMVRKIAAELGKSEPDRKVVFTIAEGVNVRADATLIKAVMDNLLGNAWKYTSKKAKADIEFGTIAVNGKSACFVKDNGAGFDMEYADKLFGAFQRLHKDNEFEGIGIGLATVQRIIHRHGGKIRAEGKVGEGATFYFTLA